MDMKRISIGEIKMGNEYMVNFHFPQGSKRIKCKIVERVGTTVKVEFPHPTVRRYKAYQWVDMNRLERLS